VSDPNRAVASLRSEALGSIGRSLAIHGWEERLKGVLTHQLESEDGIAGWLGLAATPKAERGYVSVNPVVGVHDPEVERLVAEFQGKRYRPFADGTIGRPLGYLMPTKSFRTWRFDGKTTANGAEELAEAVTRYGLPYAEENADRRKLAETLERDDFVDSRILRMPVLLLLLGEPKRALEYAHDAKRRFRSDPGPAAPAYSEFSDRLRAYVEAAES
jgi:hypothetical protein